MNEEEHLSRLETMWSVVNRAHGDSSIDARSARQELVTRYGGAVKRYLVGALRDQNDAEEVYQEFALRMVRGDFHRADPQRGQFRMFVKTAVYRMIVDFQRKRGKAHHQYDLEHDREPVADDPLGADAFALSWRSELIEKTLNTLRTSDNKSGTHLFEILIIRIEHPSLRSPEMAELASTRLNKHYSPDNFRVVLRRARLQFARLLLDEVVHSLPTPSPDELESELAELNLLEYCRPALNSRKEG